MSSTTMLSVGLVGAAVLLWRRDPTARLRQLARTDVARSAPRRLPSRMQMLTGCATSAAVWLLAASLLGVLTLPVALAAGIGAGWFQGRLEPRGVRARREAATLDLPITLELMASCLDAGAPLRMAVSQVGSLCAPSTALTLRQLDDAVRLGVHEPDAWAQLLDDPVWGAVAADMMRCSQTGAAASDVLREHAAEARRSAADARLAAARAVGVRSVLPLMTCFLPAFLLVGVVPIVASIAPKLFGH